MSSRILVAYATKCGSTAGVSDAIAQKLREGGASVDVRLAQEITDVGPYDAVVVGSPILYGRWRSEARAFVRRHEGRLSRIPVAYFLTCLELTRVQDGQALGISFFLDPFLGRPPKIEGKLSSFEKAHLLSAFVEPVLTEAPEVKPVSVGVFRGKLDYSQLDFLSWLVMRLLRLIYRRAPEGDFRNWEAIGSWAVNLSPALLQTDTKENTST
jgi:menaquinone-dependent protoporphyrinogen oxidase